jgi:hypothetical protein
VLEAMIGTGRGASQAVSAPAKLHGSDVDWSVTGTRPRMLRPGRYRPVELAPWGVAAGACSAPGIFTVSGRDYPTPSQTSFAISAFREAEDWPSTLPWIHRHMLEACLEMLSYASLEAGWDGENSVGPEPSSISSAVQFLLALPGEVASPEPGVTKDGDAEWYWKSGSGAATVSFRGNRVAYFARSDDQAVQGSVRFDGRSIPCGLLAIISAV